MLQGKNCVFVSYMQQERHETRQIESGAFKNISRKTRMAVTWRGRSIMGHHLEAGRRDTVQRGGTWEFDIRKQGIGQIGNAVTIMGK
jgi:hypothetical protein